MPARSARRALLSDQRRIHRLQAGNGRISKCGGRITRKLLLEAADVMLSRTSRALALKDWAAAVGRRSGPQQQQRDDAEGRENAENTIPPGVTPGYRPTLR